LDHKEIDSQFDRLFPSPLTVRIAPCETEILYELPEPGPHGLDVLLQPGEFRVSRAVELPSNTRIRGSGSTRTCVILEPHSNCHVMTNRDHRLGNRNIFLNNFSVQGNSNQQEKISRDLSGAYCCGFYFKNVNSIVINSINFFEISQSCIHLTHVINVFIVNIVGNIIGWSGISTSDASNVYVKGHFERAGLDVIHSALHFDGGAGIFVDAVLRDIVGNGIMLDSRFGALSGCVVRGLAERCKRGVSLTGSAINPLQDVSIEGVFRDNIDAGIMVSNADRVAISGCTVTGNKGYGILFQGRNGGNNCTIAACNISGNGTDIGHLHASRANWFFPTQTDALSFFTSSVNAHSVRALFGPGKTWFGKL
jgi:parallel beta-helix repeat protein